MKRSRWARALKRIGNAVETISYWRMVLKHMDEREKNIQIATGENHKFCEDKYIIY